MAKSSSSASLLASTVLFLALTTLWILAVRAIYLDSGLFWWLGTDFGQYFAQAQALWSEEPSNIYHPDSYSEVYRNLLGQYIINRNPIRPSSVPYPPIFPFLFTPFIKPPPVVGYLLWEGLNLIGALYLTWRSTRLLPLQTRLMISPIILTSFPIVYTLIVAQPQILLACALAECYLALRRGQDFAAGLWLSCLLIKPQYGFLVGMYLLWKGRWFAVAGSFLGGLIVLGLSVLVAGWDTLLAYPHALNEMAKFKGYGERDMINWRSLVLAARPDIGTWKGMILTQGLSLLTIIAVMVTTKGPYSSSSPTLSVHFALVVLSTLLVSHHSYSYGAVMLTFPLIATYSEGVANAWTKWSVLAGAVLPTVAFTASTFPNHVLAARLMTIAMLVCFWALLWTAWSLRSSPCTGSGRPNLPNHAVIHRFRTV
jgi:hypothetical protein